MDSVTTIGLDIAKSVFEVHGVDAVGAVVIRRKVTPAASAGIFREFAAMPRALRAREDARAAECDDAAPGSLMLNRQRTQLSNALRAASFRVRNRRTDRAGRDRATACRHQRRERHQGAGRRTALLTDARGAAHGREGADPRERPQDTGECARDGAWSQVDRDTGRGSLLARCIRRDRRGCACLRSLGDHLQSWKSLFAPDARGRRDCGIRYAERNGTRRPWLVQLMARRTTRLQRSRSPTRPPGWSGH